MAAAYAYDDFRMTFAPRDDGSYDVRAIDAAGQAVTGTFRVPLDDDTLREAILGVARSNSRKAATRDVGTAAAVTNGGPTDATTLGSALGDALLAGPIGAAYDTARRSAGQAGHGLRLSLSLAGAPGLLSVPWEFLYRRPRFLASQRKSPLVRVLDTGELAPPPAIDSKVRILGVVASPTDLNQLDVDQERARVETALAKVHELDRIELDWLQPATRRRLREVLAEGNYHVIHYIGHSDFTPEGEGVLYLEDDEGKAATLDGIELANLVGDLTNLRLVVLNSCEGARTTLTDPYAGVATTLIQLGVPAVVAMQFEISDQAAILFAEVLYTNLIGRQAPIDAAVAEARKAIFNEIDRVEFATPVLFVHDPDVELFQFQVPTAPLPPPPPPTFDHDDTNTNDHDGETSGHHGALRTTIDDPTPSPLRRRAPLLIGGAIAATAVLGVGLWIARRGDGGESLPTTGVPRERTGMLAVPLLEPDEEIHIAVFDPDRTGAPPELVTTEPGVQDRHPSWDRASNRLAFERTDGEDSGIYYVVPGDGTFEVVDGVPQTIPDGKGVQPLVVPDDGSVARFPGWLTDARLAFSRTDGCDPGPACAESIVTATFQVSDGDPPAGEYRRFISLDTLTDPVETELTAGFTNVVAVATDQSAGELVAVADDAGLWLVDATGSARVIDADAGVQALAFTPDGRFLVAGAPEAGGTATVTVYGIRDGARSTTSVASIAADAGRPDLVGQVYSLSPGRADDAVAAHVDLRGDGDPAMLAELVVAPGGDVTLALATESPLAAIGNVRGIAR